MRALYARPDGTFVVERDGLPYHVTLDDPLFTEAAALAAASTLDAEPAAVLTPPPLPLAAVTRRQLRRWLLSIGKGDADVRAAIALIEDPIEREAATIDWEDSSEYQRSHPLIARLAPGFGLTTPEQIDAAFIAAAVI